MKTYERRRANETGPRQTQRENPLAGGMPSLVDGASRKELPDAMRTKMENAFGADFSNLNIYESEKVAEGGARAVTQGNTIAFAPGEFNVYSPSSEALLGHELSHVVSQARGESRGNGLLSDSYLEAKADREGVMAAAGQQVYSGPLTPLSASSPLSVAGPMQCKKADDRKMVQETSELGRYARDGGLENSAAAKAMYDSRVDSLMANPSALKELVTQNNALRVKMDDKMYFSKDGESLAADTIGSDSYFRFQNTNALIEDINRRQQKKTKDENSSIYTLIDSFRSPDDTGPTAADQAFDFGLKNYFDHNNEEFTEYSGDELKELSQSGNKNVKKALRKQEQRLASLKRKYDKLMPKRQPGQAAPALLNEAADPTWEGMGSGNPETVKKSYGILADQMKANTSPETRDIFNDYIEDSHGYNSYLRGGGNPNSTLGRFYGPRVAQMDNALSPIGTNMKAYRGVSSVALRYILLNSGDKTLKKAVKKNGAIDYAYLQKHQKHLQGLEFSDKGFVSTSVTEEYPESWRQGLPKGELDNEIHNQLKDRFLESDLKEEDSPIASIMEQANVEKKPESFDKLDSFNKNVVLNSLMSYHHADFQSIKENLKSQNLYQGHMFEINVPKGTKAGMIDKLRKRDGVDTDAGQQEMLLGRNTRFKINQMVPMTDKNGEPLKDQFRFLMDIVDQD